MTNDEKIAKIRDITGVDRGENQHLTFTFPDDLPGYVIISSEPDVTGKRMFRWANYNMRTGFADTYIDCYRKAVAHASREW